MYHVEVFCALGLRPTSSALYSIRYGEQSLNPERATTYVWLSCAWERCNAVKRKGKQSVD